MSKQSSEAKRAFKEELYPHVIGPIMEKAKRDISEAMYEISQNEWPNKNVEYSVMRHRPMRMKHEDFIDEVMEAFIDWSRDKF